MSKMYYCGKCQKNHRYTSKIGQKHLKYKEEPPKTEDTDQGIKLRDTQVTSSQEELIKPEDSDQISHLIDELDTNLQEPADTYQTTENIDSPSIRVIKINEGLLDTNETMENMDSSDITVTAINEDMAESVSSNRVVRFIRDYQRSYKNGVERFGIWWKVFQLSIWGIIFIFFAIAGLILVVYLPKIDMINWILR